MSDIYIRLLLLIYLYTPCIFNRGVCFTYPVAFLTDLIGYFIVSFFPNTVKVGENIVIIIHCFQKLQVTKFVLFLILQHSTNFKSSTFLYLVSH